MTFMARRWKGLAVVLAGGAAALGILAGPASASTGQTTLLWGHFNFGGLTGSEFAATCNDQLQGPVTSTDSSGYITGAEMTKVTIDNCDQGVSVIADTTQPWSLTFQGDPVNTSQFTLQGVDLTITTSQGTCRYTGTIGPAHMTFPGEPGLYYFYSTLYRQTAGCGGAAQITVSDDLQEL
jgi:hypothetical protein